MGTSVVANNDNTNWMSDGQCITEKGLNLHGGSLVMAATDQFARESFGECLHFCLAAAPEQNYVLLSYFNALLVGDKVGTPVS
jgi:hypothetical protein